MNTSTLVTCTVPALVLRVEPYSLPWGSSIYAKVIAINLYGDSLISNEGNGAVIITKPDPPINLAEEYALRTKSTLGLVWDEAPFIGGTPVLDYQISIAEQGQSFTILASNLVDPNYTAIDLTFGLFYEFKVQSRNEYGYSDDSDTLTLLCAFKPDPPLIITTTNTNDLITINWDDPIWNGYVIHAYRFFILQHDGVTYSEELTPLECDGTSADVVDNRECTISLLALRSEPFNLVMDESVWVKIISINTYGESYISEPGNNAVIQLVPDAPLNFANVVEITDAFQVGLEWTEGDDGGTPVIDWRIWYRLESDTEY